MGIGGKLSHSSLTHSDLDASLTHTRITLMNADKLKVDSLNKDFTLEVTVRITCQMRLRMWVAVRLISLAAWVLGCDVDVEVNDER